MSLPLSWAVRAFPSVAVFQVEESSEERELGWSVKPLHWQTVRQTDTHALYVIQGLMVLGPDRNRRCYLDLSMPERITDFVYFPSPQGLIRDHPYPDEGDFLPAVAIEEFGSYEDFYSRRDPEARITVLRRGLVTARRKAAIAQDLAYILRDEERLEESVAAFTIAIKEGPSSHFILSERAALYEALGRHAEAQGIMTPPPLGKTRPGHALTLFRQSDIM